VSVLTNVEAGEYYTCGLDASGMLICWGDNFFGQLGDGTRIASRTATIGAGGRKYAAFDVAFSASCGIAQDGQALCWGSNGGGQLGDGTERSSQVPVKVRF
jgi:alpha-tubulin suppressor-like RCC1 family protein